MSSAVVGQPDAHRISPFDASACVCRVSQLHIMGYGIHPRLIVSPPSVYFITIRVAFRHQSYRSDVSWTRIVAPSDTP